MVFHGGVWVGHSCPTLLKLLLGEAEAPRVEVQAAVVTT